MARRVEHAPAEHNGAAGGRLVGGLVVQLGGLSQIGVGECDKPEIHAASCPTGEGLRDGINCQTLERHLTMTANVTR
eukprot:6275920-Prymnesium_polylepis.1